MSEHLHYGRVHDSLDGYILIVQHTRMVGPGMLYDDTSRNQRIDISACVHIGSNLTSVDGFQGFRRWAFAVLEGEILMPIHLNEGSFVDHLRKGDQQQQFFVRLRQAHIVAHRGQYRVLQQNTVATAM